MMIMLASIIFIRIGSWIFMAVMVHFLLPTVLIDAISWIYVGIMWFLW